jgi:hypothetical protein
MAAFCAFETWCDVSCRRQADVARRGGAGNCHTQYHPVGNCKMGIDPIAVVNPELKVHGLSGPYPRCLGPACYGQRRHKSGDDYDSGEDFRYDPVGSRIGHRQGGLNFCGVASAQSGPRRGWRNDCSARSSAALSIEAQNVQCTMLASFSRTGCRSNSREKHYDYHASFSADRFGERSCRH